MHQLHNQDNLLYVVTLFLILISCCSHDRVWHGRVFFQHSQVILMKETSINTSAVSSWAHTRLGRAGRKSAFSEVPGTLLVDFQRIRNQQRALRQYFSNFAIYPAGGRPMIRANEMDIPWVWTLVLLCRAYARCCVSQGSGVGVMPLLAPKCLLINIF